MPPSELRTPGPCPGLGLGLYRPVASGPPARRLSPAEGSSLRAGPPWSPERSCRRGDATCTSTLPHPPKPNSRPPRARPGGEQAGPAGVTHGPGAGSGVPDSRPRAANHAPAERRNSGPSHHLGLGYGLVRPSHHDAGNVSPHGTQILPALDSDGTPPQSPSARRSLSPRNSTPVRTPTQVPPGRPSTGPGSVPE